MTVYLFEDKGAYYVRWFCPAPDYGIEFYCLKDNWVKGDDGKWIREIYEIKLAE